MPNYNVVCPHCQCEHDKSVECDCSSARLEQCEKTIAKIAELFHVPVDEYLDVDHESLLLAVKAAATAYTSIIKDADMARQLTGHRAVLNVIVAHNILQRRWKAVKDFLGGLPNCAGNNDHHSHLIREAKEVCFGTDEWIYDERLEQEK